MNTLESIFNRYNRRYETILENLYPAKNDTGFPERNLSINFAAAYEAEHPESVTWYEFQFGEQNNLHLDALIVNRKENEILLIESKRFKNASKQVERVEADINRIRSIPEACCEEFENRIKGFMDFHIIGVILADVWTQSKPKTSIKEAFAAGTFVELYLKDKSLVENLQQCGVKYYLQKPQNLDSYYLTSLVWEIHKPENTD